MTKPLHTSLEIFTSDWGLPAESRELLSRWHESFETSERQVDNLSIIRYTSDQAEIPLPDQALLMLHTNQGFWSMANDNSDSKNDASIEITQHSETSLRQQLRAWIDRFATPVSHS
ncbi:hypothetical protein [Paenibacillus amylolyticus]|uniref:hypothetical protein n=1 Tax=Paenibacillus amylolyticus TaxID=1451 RepID=UPI003EB87033